MISSNCRIVFDEHLTYPNETLNNFESAKGFPLLFFLCCNSMFYSLTSSVVLKCHANVLYFIFSSGCDCMRVVVVFCNNKVKVDYE